jgi:hypothetical protein
MKIADNYSINPSTNPWKYKQYFTYQSIHNVIHQHIEHVYEAKNEKKRETITLYKTDENYNATYCDQQKNDN